MSQPDPEFAPSNLEAWALAAAKSAPGGDLSRLNWVTPDGIEVKPLYTARDVEGLRYTDTLPGFEPYLRGPQATMYAARPWNRMPSIARAWRAADKACRWRSTWRPTAAMTATTRA